MGAVLYQLSDSGEKRIISCSSAKFNQTEQSYHINEQEVLAVVYGIKKYQQYLEDRPFYLVTDSKALQWLHHCRDDRAKLTRWALLLQEYSYTVIHKPGAENNLPDFLSRYPEEAEPQLVQEANDIERILPPPTDPVRAELEPQITAMDQARASPAPEQTRKRRRRRRRRQGPAHPEDVPPCFLRPSMRLNLLEDEAGPIEEPLYEAVARAQRESPEYQATKVRWHRLVTGEDQATERWQRVLRDDYRVDDDLIWHVADGHPTLVVPLEWWPRVIYEYHDSPHAGHPGRDETIRAIQRLYHWPAMRRQVKTHIKHCLICASTKRGALQPAAPLRPHPPTRPWQCVSVDVMGPYAETRHKNRFLIVLTDIFSKWVELKAVPTTSGTAVVDFLEDVCHRWGYPEVVITDNGAQFRSRVWERFLQTNHITGYFVPIYHQRSNPVERRNQEVKKLLRQYLIDKPERTWDRYTSLIRFALNSRSNTSTGQSPSRLLLGTEIARPGDWQHPRNRQPQPGDPAAERRRRVDRARARQIVFQRNLYPEPRRAPAHYEVGDQVMVRLFAGSRTPLGPTWSGPHPVIVVHGEGVYEVDRNGNQERYHIDDLRGAPGPEPAPADQDELALPPPDDANDPLQGGAEAPGDEDGEAASQASDEPDRPGSDRPRRPQAVGDEVHDLDGPACPGPSRLPPTSRGHPVVVEDAEETDDEGMEQCAHLGVPIVGLFP